MFTLKNSIQNKKNSSEEASIKDDIDILKDRLFAYTTIANRNNCVQLLIAEQEVTNSLKSLIKNIKDNQKSEFKSEKITEIINIFEENSITSNCQVPSYFKSITYPLDFLNIQYLQASQLKDLINLQKNKSVNKFSEFLNNFTNGEYNTQQNVLELSNLLLIAKKNNTLVDTLIKKQNYFDTILKLQTNKLIYDYVDNHSDSDFKTQQSLITAICNLSDIKICVQETIESKWNTIYKGELSDDEKVEEAEKVYKEYLREFIK